MGLLLLVILGMQKGNSGSSPMDLRKCDIFCVCGKGSIVVIVKGGKRELISLSVIELKLVPQKSDFLSSATSYILQIFVYSVFFLS